MKGASTSGTAGAGAGRPNDGDLAFADVETLGGWLRAGVVSSVELAEFFLERLERLGPRYNCVATLTRELALERARRADAELREGRDRGPLHGIPVGVKDLLATRGAATSWGAAPYRDRVIDRDATVVRRLEEAGAVLAAKLAMVEIAGGMGYRQANASFTGPGLNPWDLTKWSGGSSSGSGSAVAAGLTPLAIGTETWGSITTPSAYCGLTGLRPTYGRVSRAGAMALAYTLDKIGPMGRTARDCGHALAAIAGFDAEDDSTTEREFRYPDPGAHPGRPFRLGVIEGAEAGAHPDTRANYLAALETFREMGATIETARIPEGAFSAVASTILGAEAASAHEDLVDSGLVGELTAPEDRIGGYADQSILATEYLRAQRLRRGLCRVLDAWLSRFDAVVTLPVGGPPPGAEGRFGGRYGALNLSGPGNLCGTPALVLPSGMSKEGTPTAIQLDGRAYSEGLLLAIGAAFQARTGHHRGRPPETT